MNKKSHMTRSTCKFKVIYTEACLIDSPNMALSLVSSVTYANDMGASRLPAVYKGNYEFVFPNPSVFA